MTDKTDKPAPPKVVSMCGRAIDLTANVEPPAAIEARRAKEQLAHWSTQTARYVALILCDDGRLAFCGSMDSPAETLQYAATLHRYATDMAHLDLTGEAPAYGDPEDDPE